MKCAPINNVYHDYCVHIFYEFRKTQIILNFRRMRGGCGSFFNDCHLLWQIFFKLVINQNLLISLLAWGIQKYLIPVKERYPYPELCLMKNFWGQSKYNQLYAPNAFLVYRYSINFVKFVLLVKFCSMFVRETSFKKTFNGTIDLSDNRNSCLLCVSEL